MTWQCTDPPSSETSSSSLEVGLSVGLVVAVILVVIFCGCVLWIRRRGQEVRARINRHPQQRLGVAAALGPRRGDRMIPPVPPLLERPPASRVRTVQPNPLPPPPLTRRPPPPHPTRPPPPPPSRPPPTNPHFHKTPTTPDNTDNTNKTPTTYFPSAPPMTSSFISHYPDILPSTILPPLPLPTDLPPPYSEFTPSTRPKTPLPTQTLTPLTPTLPQTHLTSTLPPPTRPKRPAPSPPSSLPPRTRTRRQATLPILYMPSLRRTVRPHSPQTDQD